MGRLTPLSMNIIFTLEALEYAGFRGLINVAQENLEGGTVNLVFAEGFTNIQVANIISSLMRKNPTVDFTMIMRIPPDGIRDIMGSTPEVVTLPLDKPNILN